MGQILRIGESVHRGGRSGNAITERKPWISVTALAEAAQLNENTIALPRATSPPRELTQIYSHLFAHEMPVFWEQGLFLDAKDLSEEFNLLAIRRTAERLYVRQYVARHIDISKQLQLGDQFILRPA
jgi:hypothetical protein